MFKRLLRAEEGHATLQTGPYILSQKSKRLISVRISTMDAELEFRVDVGINYLIPSLKSMALVRKCDNLKFENKNIFELIFAISMNKQQR